MTKKISIPLLLKHDFTLRAYSSIVKGFLYAIRDKFGPATALEIYARVCTMGDRIKNLTNSIIDIFQVKGNDAETISNWFDVWWELTGGEHTTLEQSKISSRHKITKCPFKTEPKDIRDWALIMVNLVAKTINPKTTVERPKAMCAGDPYCEYVWKIEE